jgi:hypothetical protein
MLGRLADEIDTHDQRKATTKRIKELNDKATQVLLFLSFAMVAAVTLRSTLTDGGQKRAATLALQWWTVAVFPALLCVLPLKEIRPDDVGWYKILRGLKVALLWLALICFAVGAGWFFKAI